MSILSALKTQNNSIDDLASLPQPMIMQMAQKGQIRQDLVMPILARKAEMVEAAARSKAMQQQGIPPTTVLEQILQKNAVAENPVPREMGVAQLPVKPDMYDERRMAGGGIVAFQNNQDQPVSSDMPEMTDEERAEYIRKNPYLQRSQSVSKGLGELFTLRNWDPLQSGARAINQFVVEPVKKYVSEPTSSQMDTWNRGRMARTGEIPTFVGEDKTAKGKMVDEGRMTSDQNVRSVLKKEAKTADDMAKFDEATKLFEQERAAAKQNKTGNVATKKDQGASTKVESPKEDALSKYEKMLMEEREAAKGAREEAKWARMLEAGLGILGGESPYAFANIGKGAQAGLKGYGEDVRELRKEERGRIKELMGIEERRQDVDYKNKLLRIQELAATKPDSTTQIIALGRKAGLDDRALLGLLAGNKDTENSAKNIASKAYFDNLAMYQKKYPTLESFLAAQGIGGGGGGAPVLNYVPGQKLK